MLPSSFRKLILLITPFILPGYIYAQALPVDIPKAFNSIDLTPQLLRLKNNGVKIPAGGHLQGIQCLSDSLMIITASSGSISYYLAGKADITSGKGQINKLQKIADSPYRHAGGCQLNGLRLVAGIEDNIAKNKSDITMISFNPSLQEISRNIIARRHGSVKRSTAGAAGFAKTLTSQYLVAVGDWDSRNIDFYLSRPGSDTLFDSLTTFHAPGNQKWCSYQSINLLIDASGNIYLIGFGLDGTHNRADLFQVEFDKTQAALKLISTRNFSCKGGAGFRYGSGLSISNDHRLTIYTCARNIGSHLAVNIFAPK